MNDFQTPNQDPGSERRLLLTFALTFVVIFITQQFISKYYKPPAPAPRQEQTQNSVPAPLSAGSPSTAEPPAKTAAAAVPAKQASTESTTVIENDLYKITFSNHGGVAKSWVLKKYK
ncbi:MAG TPA: membrane protein insertase YidC, partial [Terriglobales bacterium]|nr:membrane protein insertase YidC [Terriglobales bacterium]